MIVIITACLNYSECESGGEFDVVHCADDDERDVQMRLYGPRMRLQPNCKLIISGACFHREEVKDSIVYIYNQNRGMRTREEIRLDAEKAKKKEELENDGCRKERDDKKDQDEKQEEEVDEEDEGEEDSEEEDENSNTEDG